MVFIRLESCSRHHASRESLHKDKRQCLHARRKQEEEEIGSVIVAARDKTDIEGAAAAKITADVGRGDNRAERSGTTVTESCQNITACAIRGHRDTAIVCRFGKMERGRKRWLQRSRTLRASELLFSTIGCFSTKNMRRKKDKFRNMTHWVM